MCGRFVQSSAIETILNRYRLISYESLKIAPRFNIAPTQSVPVIVREDNTTRYESMRWGLVPHWAKDDHGTKPLINARAETVSDKPSFKTPFRRHRCLIPASGFYEWKRNGTQKTPYYIQPADEQPICFAGLWDRWNKQDGSKLHSFSIITTTANEIVKPIHDRMPVILNESDEALWLNTEEHNPEHLQALLKPYPARSMKAHAVTPLVNNVQHDSPDCLAPGPEQGDLF
jgi:putative SOS response-associated peptidase YedK